MFLYIQSTETYVLCLKLTVTDFSLTSTQIQLKFKYCIPQNKYLETSWTFLCKIIKTFRFDFKVKFKSWNLINSRL